MVRTLVIPHVPLRRDLRIRSVEIARCLALASGGEVCLLDWRGGRPVSNPIVKLWCRMREACIAINQRTSWSDWNPVRVATIPHLFFPPLISGFCNGLVLDRFIRTHEIDVVINANAFQFGLSKKTARRVTYIYDLVDDHLSKEPKRSWRRSRSFCIREFPKAQSIITISQKLQMLLRNLGYESTLVPNGVDTATYRCQQDGAVAEIRRMLDLDGRRVIAYIGNHSGWFSNIPFLLEAFRLLRKKIGDVALLVVGPMREEERRALAVEPSVIVTGPVSATEVHNYFQVADIGVLPFLPGPFTDNSLPLKVLEFGAARKSMVAAPLEELRLVGFPHVELTPLDTDLWAETICQMLLGPQSWPQEWDELIEKYDWSNVVKPLVDITERAKARIPQGCDGS